MWALDFSRNNILKRGVVEREVGDDALELPVLVFQGAQSLGVADLHATKLALPVVESRVGDAVLTNQVLELNTCIPFLQHPDDLLFRESLAFHVILQFPPE